MVQFHLRFGHMVRVVFTCVELRSTEVSSEQNVVRFSSVCIVSVISADCIGKPLIPHTGSCPKESFVRWTLHAVII